MNYLMIRQKIDQFNSNGGNSPDPSQPRILIFTEGTVLGYRHWWEFFQVKNYVPIGRCVEKILGWEKQGAQIVYLTSCRKQADVAAIRDILVGAGFPGCCLYYRGQNEEYHYIAEQIVPDVLIEDDCRSIGGRRNWTITYIQPEIKERIHSIVVPEFHGIDHLPADLSALLT